MWNSLPFCCVTTACQWTRSSSCCCTSSFIPFLLTVYIRGLDGRKLRKGGRNKAEINTLARCHPSRQWYLWLYLVVLERGMLLPDNYSMSIYVCFEVNCSLLWLALINVGYSYSLYDSERVIAGIRCLSARTVNIFNETLQCWLFRETSRNADLQQIKISTICTPLFPNRVRLSSIYLATESFRLVISIRDAGNNGRRHIWTACRRASTENTVIIRVDFNCWEIAIVWSFHSCSE